jgi:hypothetical protein
LINIELVWARRNLQTFIRNITSLVDKISSHYLPPTMTRNVQKCNKVGRYLHLVARQQTSELWVRRHTVSIPRPQKHNLLRNLILLKSILQDVFVSHRIMSIRLHKASLKALTGIVLAIMRELHKFNGILLLFSKINQKDSCQGEI